MPSGTSIKAQTVLLRMLAPVLGWLGALFLIFLAAWSVETTWIRPSLAALDEGSAGRTQWGGVPPELRQPPRIFMDNDPYYWIAYARQMVVEGGRIRHTDLDNVPYGRDVHWNTGFVIWLVICGAVASLLTGQPIAQAIETGSLYANPVLFLLVLALSGWWVARRFGGFMAMGLLILLPALPAISWDFGFARPDHHGMHDFAALGLLLGLILGGGGWVKSSREREGSLAALNWPNLNEAATAFRISAIAGGIGLWVGATQQAFMLGSAGLALMMALVFVPKGTKYTEGLRFAPELLRTWGHWGFGASTFFYVLEYFPMHMSMHLEVNHPLYALAWLGGAEMLFQMARWKMTGTRPAGNGSWYLVLGFLAVLILPLALLLGPAEWHAWHDEFMRRQHEFINEFEPLSNSMQDRGIWELLLRFGLLPLAIPVALFFLVWKKFPGPLKAVVLVAILPVLVTSAMMVIQVRWAGLVSVTLAVLALILTWLVWNKFKNTPVREKALMVLLPGILILPNLIFFLVAFKDSCAQAESGSLDPTLAWTIASRDVAFNLKRIAGGEIINVMSGPGQTPSLHFFGGVRGTGSLYWENIDGVRDAAAFFSDQGEDRAKEIVRSRNITYVVLEQSPVMASQSCGVYYGRQDDKEIQQSLAWRLASPLGKIPDWLEPVPYYGSPMASNFQMRVYRVLKNRL